MGQPSPERLRGAAQLIREVGHAKGHYEEWEDRADGKVVVAHCAVGALATAARTSVFDVRAETRYLSRMLGYDPDTRSEMHNMVSAWNDLDSTTAEDVINLLESAAEKLEADL